MSLNFYRKNVLLLFIGCCFTTLLYAQQADSTAFRDLTEVEVVQQKRPSVTRQATPVQLMERTEIDRLGLQELSEAIRRFSGVTVKDYGGVGGLKTVSVRSLGAQHTAVSYDGITVSDVQSGQVDISRFSLDNVESVSLSIGQTNELFQTARISASAGALSIQTERPVFTDKSFRLKGHIRSGSFGYVNTLFRYDQQLSDQYAFSFHTDWQRADGKYPYTLVNGNLVTEEKRHNSDIQAFRNELNIYADWKQAGNLKVKGYWFDSERGLPGSVVLYNDYSKERLFNKNGFVQVGYENTINELFAVKGLAKFDYAWTKYQDFHSRYENGEQTDKYIQKEYYASIVGLYTPTSYLTFSLAEDFFINTLDNTLPKCPFPTRYTTLTAFSAQYQNSRFTATAGLLGTYITEEVKTDIAAPDRKRLSPSVSVSYRLLNDQNLRVRASYKDIFRNPTFNDLYYDRIGNRELESEKASLYNVGLLWSGKIEEVALDYLSISVDGYYNRVKDKIVAIPTMFIWKMMNMGRVDIKGIDVNLSSRFSLPSSMFLQVDGNYSWQEATDATDKESKIYGHQIPYTPVHSGNLSVSLENPWVNVSWLLTAVGDRYALAQNIEKNLIEGYIEQQVSFNRDFQLKKVNLRLHAEILNIGNVTYDVINYYPMPGRSFRAGIIITY